MSEKIKLTNEAVLISLFAAFISAGCFIQVPFFGGVPIVFQDMFAIFTGLMLGAVYGSIAVIVFLCLGILGLPVFSGKAGLHVILHGVTGGFLIGYLFAAFTAGILAKFFLKVSSAPTVLVVEILGVRVAETEHEFFRDLCLNHLVSVSRHE